MLIVLVATGGLEVPLAGALAADGLPVVVVNPRQVLNFSQAIQNSPVCRNTDDLLRGVPEVEPVLTTTVPTNFLELNTVTKKQIAALANVAPRNCDSGTAHGTRMVGGGRTQIPATGYMATIVATGYNLAVKAFYRLLCGLGNAKKVALIACMQKRLTTRNAIRKPRTPWRTEQPLHA